MQVVVVDPPWSVSARQVYARLDQWLNALKEGFGCLDRFDLKTIDHANGWIIATRDRANCVTKVHLGLAFLRGQEIAKNDGIPVIEKYL